MRDRGVGGVAHADSKGPCGRFLMQEHGRKQFWFHLILVSELFVSLQYLGLTITSGLVYLSLARQFLSVYTSQAAAGRAGMHHRRSCQHFGAILKMSSGLSRLTLFVDGRFRLMSAGSIAMPTPP